MTAPRGGALAVLACVAGMSLPDQAAGASRTLHLGFLDPALSFESDAGVRSLWLGRMAGVGADRVRVSVQWGLIATRVPRAGEDPADPAWPGYSWTSLDLAVAAAFEHGLQPIMTFGRAPAWAESRPRASGAPAGTWRPQPAALAAFARAAARRYPSVRYWQAWNEPNLNVYLTPQWRRGRPAAPAHYRRMLNAFYGAIKGVRASNVVISAGTAPYGDSGPFGERIRPARFVRELLCLGAPPALRRLPCPAPARFDVLAHHPYSVGSPARRALNDDDVSVPDLAKLVGPLRRAERTGRALPSKRHALWVTEMSWDSSPPDPLGVPSARHAQWLQEAFYVLWRAGADTILWFLLRDQPPEPSFAATYQSGLYLRDGRPKPAATAFAFPFVGVRDRTERVVLWGRAPAAGRIVVQRSRGGAWHTLASFRAGRAGDVFTRTVSRLPRGTRLRAVAGTRTSLVWTVRRTS